MKKQLLVLIAFFLTTRLSFSQDTLANMLEVGNKWSRYIPAGNDMAHLINEEIVKDTIILNIKYSKVKSTLFSYSNPINFSINYYFLGKSSNTIFRFYPNNFSKDNLYRFSGLNIGDSITVYPENGINLHTNKSYTIDSVDYILVGTKIIKRLRLSVPLTDNTIINGNVTVISEKSSIYFYDGIGSEGAGIYFAPFQGALVPQFLTCFQTQNQTFVHKWHSEKAHSFYKDTMSECKFIVLGIKENSLTSEITLSKTTENQIQLSTSISLSNAQLTLYDMKGSAFAASLQQDNTIDVSNLQAGLYVLRLQTADQKLVSFKFLKQ